MFGAIHQAFKRGMELTGRLAPPDRALEFHRAVYSAIHPRKPEEARRQMAERLNDAKALLLQACLDGDMLVTRSPESAASIYLDGVRCLNPAP